MSKEFIQHGYGKSGITEATKQESQLAYFTVSKTQENLPSNEQLNQWFNRKFETSDYFLNFVKAVFKTENFLDFFKYIRYPLPSAKLIKNDIIPNLKRVFHAEDSLFDYKVINVDADDFVADLDPLEFNRMMFDAFMTKHNSILITDLREANEPVRCLIDIDDVVSIVVNREDEIEKIAFEAGVMVEDTFVKGYAVIDSDSYSFYDKDFKEIAYNAHDLGYTPAHFISPRVFSEDRIVRQSKFSYVRYDLEEYVFLKTIQRMTEPNGAIPIYTYLDNDDKKQNDDFRSEDKEVGGYEAMSSQRAEVQQTTVRSSQGHLQTGTAIGVEPIYKADGSLDMDAVRNFINFFRVPVDALDFINKRVNELESEIVSSMIGDVTNTNEDAKNELQVRKAITVLENTLRDLSNDFSRIRHLADKDFLSLKYGADRVIEVTTFYGSDFFLESESELLKSFKEAPNPIERKDILLRLNHTRYKNNIEKLNRQEILYSLLPYSADVDFQDAITRSTVSSEVFELQTRFTYWINQFEAEYGDIVEFYNNFESSPAERLAIINNLIVQLIPKQNEVRTGESI